MCWRKLDDARRLWAPRHREVDVAGGRVLGRCGGVGGVRGVGVWFFGGVV